MGSSTWLLFLSVLSTVVWASPTPNSATLSVRDRPPPPAPDSSTFTVDFVSPPWDADPVLVDGSRCVSPCGQGISFSHTTSVSYGLDFGLSGGPGGDLTKILTAALSGGFSASWGTSDTKGQSTTVDCPTGPNYICGIQASSRMISSTGSKQLTENSVFGSKVSYHTYHVDAPALADADAQPSIVTYQTCLFNPLPPDAEAAVIKKFPMCPGQ